MKKKKNYKNGKFLDSFKYAWNGIKMCISQERNMRIHCVITILVVAAGTFFHLSGMEWCICLLFFGLVIALEMVNTALETVVDLVTEEEKYLAKIAKDTAAGAVLVAAILAAFAGCIIFIPKILSL